MMILQSLSWWWFLPLWAVLFVLVSMAVGIVLAMGTYKGRH